jgi:hypothetical protein
MRTKIKNEKSDKWNTIPVVMIMKAIKKLPIYKQLSNPSVDFKNQARKKGISNADVKQNFSSNTWNCPTELYFTFQYKKQDAEIRVWWHQEGRYNVAVQEPVLVKYFPTGRYNAIKGRGSFYLDGFINKVEDAIRESMTDIDEEVQEQIMHDQFKKAQDDFRTELADELQQTFEKDDYTPNTFGVRYSENYQMSFRLVEPISYSKLKANASEELYRVTGIGGEYSLDDIKALIKVIFGNPRAISDRLLNA